MLVCSLCLTIKEKQVANHANYHNLDLYARYTIKAIKSLPNKL